MLTRNWTAVMRQLVADISNNTTADHTAICVEVMLFSIAAEMNEWPDGWAHKHYFWPAPDNTCSCGMCVHGIEDARTTCRLCIRERHKAHIDRLREITRDVPITDEVAAQAAGIISVLVMGTPQR